MAAGPTYPLIVRNRSALLPRVFMLAFLGLLAVGTSAEIQREVASRVPWVLGVLALLWLCGTVGLVSGLRMETSELRINRPRSVSIRRRATFSRSDAWIDRGRLRIEEGEDNEGHPYFKLMLDAPGGPLCVREGHSRGALAAMQNQIQAAAGWD